LNLELLKKNNDFIINNCFEIIKKIKELSSFDISDPYIPNKNIKSNFENFYESKSKGKNSYDIFIKMKAKKHNNNNVKKNSLLNQHVFKNDNKFSTFSTGFHFNKQIDKESQKFLFDYQDPILPSSDNKKDYFDIFDWDDIEICKQLTLITHFIFEKIKFKELINSRWTKIDKKSSAPNVCRLIERFNKISLWACEEILSYDKSSLRKLVLDKFINIAYILCKMNNFNDSFSIVTALNSFFIKDLKKSWRRIDVNLSIPKAKELNDIFSNSKNFAQLRKQIDNCSGKPCIPFLGLYLKDLSFLDEAEKYILSKECVEKEKILKYYLNVDKIKKVDIILKKFEENQKFKYQFKPVFKLSFLANPDPLSEKSLIDLGRKLGNYYFFIRILNLILIICLMWFN